LSDLSDPQISSEELREKYGLTDNRDWKLDFGSQAGAFQE